MAFKNFQEMIDAVKAMENKTKVCVVNAQDEHTLQAVSEAVNEGLIDAILVGDEAQIKEILEKLGQDVSKYTIVPAATLEESLATSVQLVKDGKAHALMKGKLQTAEIMRAVVHDDYLKGTGMISLIGLYETPKYHKLFAVSDIGMNTYPDLEAKKKIVINGVNLLHAMGVETPKVGCLAAVEKLNPKMPETVDGDALKQMSKTGEIPGCIIEGPISFDLAMVKGAAAVKGYESPVAEDADFLLAPDIVCGNVLVKCLTEFADAETAGIMYGAAVPMIITSRSAKPSDKFNSIALTAFVAQNM